MAGSTPARAASSGLSPMTPPPRPSRSWPRTSAATTRASPRRGGKRRIAAYDPAAAAEQVVAEDIGCNDLVVNPRGGIYVTDPDKHQVWYLPPGPAATPRGERAGG